MKSRILMWILWPSFLAALACSGVVFALVDPLDMVILGHIRAERNTVYTLVFFLLWLMAAVSSALSLFMYPGQQALKEPADDLD